ncbi:MAG: glycosyltransferase family 2 protein [Salaquimonas sp.]|nr:glycosyltransferase family 2 protein [Salaquimonas sp.]
MRDDLAIIIPALNEAATIGGIVASLRDSGRVIVVDDGSTDNTGRIASDSGALVITHEVNRGYDAALDSGFARASELDCVYAVTLDADGQHPEAKIAEFVSALDQGADLVLGIRDQLQRFGESAFAFAARLRFGIRDPLCGMKGYRLDLYRSLGHFDSYSSIGTELMLYGAAKGARIVQVALETRERADAPRFGRAFRANMRILRAMTVGLKHYGIFAHGQSRR